MTRSAAKLRLVSVVALAMVGFACAAPAERAVATKTIHLDRHAAGSVVTLRKGELLALSLPGNPTTGYLWELLPGAEPVLTPQGKPEFVRGGDLLGAGGVYRFTFAAVAQGRARLRLVYHRPFEKEKPAAQVFEVEVVVK